MRKRGLIADNVHGSIELTEFERKIMAHVAFNRLHDVYQNSTVYLTFPSNRTKRFEHSVGTMKLCNDIFCAALWNTDKTVCRGFLEFYKKELVKIVTSIKTVKYKEYGLMLGGRVRKMNSEDLPCVSDYYATFNSLGRELDNYYTTYFILLQAIRISALLHDIGHPPYSHITEYAMEDLKEQYKDSKENNRIIEFNRIMEGFFINTNKKKLHERMGDTITSIILEDSIEPLSVDCANANQEAYDMQVIYILVKETIQKIFSNEKPFDCLHRIIDGTLDGDRMDYVTRDPLNAGLDKGKIEYDRLCKGMVIALDDEKGYWIAPTMKSLNTVEDFLNRRWELYKSIIFHHRVIKTDYLLQSTIRSIATDYLNNNIEEQQEDNSDLLPANISGLWWALKSSANRDSSYAISQWDDSWLMTVLKKHYFRNYIGKNNIIAKQLEELLTSKKNYFSVIKRLEDFLIVDNAISEGILNYREELNKKLQELTNLSEEFKSDSAAISVDPFIKDLNRILDFAKLKQEMKVFQGLIYSQLRKTTYFMSDTDGIAMIELVQEAVEESKKKNLENYVDDVFVVIKKYDIGVKKPLYLYDEKREKLVSIHEVSSVARLLDLSYDTFPQFFIYILKNRRYQNEIIDVNSFLKDIGKIIAQKFFNKWMETLNKNIIKYNTQKKESSKYVQNVDT